MGGRSNARGVEDLGTGILLELVEDDWLGSGKRSGGKSEKKEKKPDHHY
jgi:hypothetical protein